MRDRWFSPLIGLLGGLVYWATLAPGLITKLYATFDTDKYHAIVPALGIPHHPGYPIYMLLGWLFTLLPIGTIAGRVNLLSAVAGGVAIALACALMRRLGVRRIIAGAVALSFGFGLVFWKNAVVAEVYTLASAQLFGGIPRAGTVARRPSPEGFLSRGGLHRTHRVAPYGRTADGAGTGGVRAQCRCPLGPAAGSAVSEWVDRPGGTASLRVGHLPHHRWLVVR